MTRASVARPNSFLSDIGSTSLIFKPLKSFPESTPVVAETSMFHFWAREAERAKINDRYFVINDDTWSQRTSGCVKSSRCQNWNCQGMDAPINFLEQASAIVLYLLSH